MIDNTIDNSFVRPMEGFIISNPDPQQVLEDGNLPYILVHGGGGNASDRTDSRVSFQVCKLFIQDLPWEFSASLRNSSATPTPWFGGRP